MMKSIPVVGKIAMLAAILGLFLGMSAFCFFDAGSKVYGVLILLIQNNVGDMVRFVSDGFYYLCEPEVKGMARGVR